MKDEQTDAGTGGAVLPDRRLKEREEGLRLLVESVSDYAIFMLDPAGFIMSWNAGAERMKGWRAHEIIGQHFSRFYSAEDVAAGKPVMELRIATAEGRYEEEGWRFRKDGTQFFAHVSITAVRDAAGTLRGFGKVTRDITERMRTDMALRESEERFRLLVESVGDYAIYMLDPEGYVASWNTGAERLKGWRADEAIGQHVSLFHTPEGRAARKPQIELQIAREQGVFREEAERLRKDGSIFMADVTLTALFDEQRRLRGFAKVTRDMTERKRAEDAVRELNRDLELRVAARTAELSERNAELNAFAYSIAHDLRAPLRGIIGFADALAEDFADILPAEATGYLGRITAAAGRMNDLIEDLLAYSRLGQGEISPVRVDLEPLLRDILENMRTRLDERNAEVEIIRPLATPRAHYATLQQVVVNLIENAVKFVPPDRRPHVRIHTETHGGAWVRLWVEDNGIGIAPEHQTRIFNIFERLHGQGSYEGTGVGLAVVRRASERLGGKAGVESEPGSGSRFWVDLPAASERSE
ncbi:PAS domain S-box protein [Chelativorans sp.]|uniref:sensor histidine kinase n=1 Tax=Chelativorans sp. TaxID=2203393 RepID=UPI002810CA76|nr:PAS domain S-box protein [Chelativorans sp.]